MNITNIISELTLNELELLSKLIDSPEQASVVHTKADGSLASKLFKKGLIRKAGKVGTAIRWQVKTELITREHRDFVRQLLHIHIRQDRLAFEELEKRVEALEEKND